MVPHVNRMPVNDRGMSMRLKMGVDRRVAAAMRPALDAMV